MKPLVSKLHFFILVDKEPTGNWWLKYWPEYHFAQNDEDLLKIWFSSISQIWSFCDWRPFCVRRRGVVDRIPAFQAVGSGFIPARVGDLNLYPGTGCVSFICVVYCVVSGGGPAVIFCWPQVKGSTPLCIYLVLWSIVCGSPYKHLFHGYFGCESLRVQVLHWTRVNKFRKERKYLSALRDPCGLNFLTLILQ